MTCSGWRGDAPRSMTLQKRVRFGVGAYLVKPIFWPRLRAFRPLSGIPSPADALTVLQPAKEIAEQNQRDNTEDTLLYDGLLVTETWGTGTKRPAALAEAAEHQRSDQCQAAPPSPAHQMGATSAPTAFEIAFEVDAQRSPAPAVVVHRQAHQSSPARAISNGARKSCRGLPLGLRFHQPRRARHHHRQPTRCRRGDGPSPRPRQLQPSMRELVQEPMNCLSILISLTGVFRRQAHVGKRAGDTFALDGVPSRGQDRHPLIDGDHHLR